MEKLVGQEITCRIIKLDVAGRRRRCRPPRHRSKKKPVRSTGSYAALKEGDIVTGQVRSLTTYGAFVDLGGIDGLLHVSDISWSRVNNPEDVLSVGQQLSSKSSRSIPKTAASRSD